MKKARQIDDKRRAARRKRKRALRFDRVGFKMQVRGRMVYAYKPRLWLRSAPAPILFEFAGPAVPWGL